MACSDETRFQGIATALEAGLFPWREELWTCSDETRFQGIATPALTISLTSGAKRTCSDETRFQGIATRRCEMARQQTWEEFLQ